MRSTETSVEITRIEQMENTATIPFLQQENKFAPYSPITMDYMVRPNFSFDWLPSCALKTLCEESARYNCIKPDLPAITALGYISAMAQGRIGILMDNGKPFDLNIFLIAAAKVAQRKSTVFKDFRAMIWKFEHETESSPQIIIDNATFRSVLDQCAENEGRLFLASGDGGGSIDDLTHYNNHKLDLFLMSQNGESYTYNTHGAGKIFLQHPIISILLLSQYAPVEKMNKSKRLKERGFLSRCLTAYINPIDEFEDNEPIIDQVMFDRAENDLHSILCDHVCGDGYIKLSEQAAAGFRDFKKQIGKREELDCIDDWKARIHENLIKIAGILQTMEFGVRAPLYPVTEDTMEKAICIMEYFISHAISDVGEYPYMQDVLYLYEKIKELAEGNSTLSERELKQRTKSRFRKGDDVSALLGILAEHGYIRSYSVPSGGRPSTMIEVNPEACKDF